MVSAIWTEYLANCCQKNLSPNRVFLRWLRVKQLWTQERSRYNVLKDCVRFVLFCSYSSFQWSKEDLWTYQVVTGQYPSDMQSRRTLYLDMLQKLLPHKSRQSLVSCRTSLFLFNYWDENSVLKVVNRIAEYKTSLSTAHMELHLDFSFFLYLWSLSFFKCVPDNSVPPKIVQNIHMFVFKKRT